MRDLWYFSGHPPMPLHAVPVAHVGCAPSQGSGCQDCVLHRQKHKQGYYSGACAACHWWVWDALAPWRTAPALPLLLLLLGARPQCPVSSGMQLPSPSISLCASTSEREFCFPLLVLPFSLQRLPSPINTCRAGGELCCRASLAARPAGSHVSAPSFSA